MAAAPARLLPDFLGIGCVRAGSTWLHNLLDAHPDVYVPQRRKEIHFFLTPNYEKGLRWYGKFFPRAAEAHTYKAIGEIGPGYLYRPECIDRIAAVPSIDRFLVMLRDPVERAYSQYRWQMRYHSRPLSLWQYVAKETRILEEGLYAKYLQRWIETFGRHRFLILMLEQVRKDAAGARRQVADFLGLDPDRFPSEAGVRAINHSDSVARPALYFFAARAYSWLIRHDLDQAVRPLRSTGKWLVEAGKRIPLPTLDEDTRRYLQFYYEQPNAMLAKLLHADLSDWQTADGRHRAAEDVCHQRRDLR